MRRVSLIVCFCLESLLMLITLLSVWEKKKKRVKNIFLHKHKHFDRMQTRGVYRPTNPHLSAPPLSHRRKLNICLFSPSLLQNLASLSNFSFFFFFSFFFLVRSGIPSTQPNSIYSSFFFFFSSFGACSFSLWGVFGTAAAGPTARPKPLQDEPQSSSDRIDETEALTHVLSCRVAWLKCATLENISALHPLK